jgi:dUTP pyrophosphatase
MRFRAIPSDTKDDMLGNWYLDYENFPYKAGDRIGQMFLEKVINIEFNEVKELSETERGEGGFGSTGRN